MLSRRAGRPLALALAAALTLLASGRAAAQDPGASARRLLDQMAPAERVGQLFVVPFRGDDAGPDSAVAGMIVDGHVGGVILDPGRGNFTDAPDAPARLAALTADLQARAAEAEGPYVPLLVALAQKGDDYPDSPLVGGMTPLPSPMALGATWNPDLADRMGNVVGRELAAVGVNLLLGPDLDVLDVPQPVGAADRGVRSFGGSPAWVAQMGGRYIEGVHTGGRGRVAVAAGNFPGIGGADRSPEEEVAVVEKSLAQLLDFELVPYEAAAEPARPGGSADAFVTSHVRYRAIQRQLERPFSMDSGGLRYLWSQVPALGDWRAAGGLWVSPGLGLPAVRRYDDPSLKSFNHRRVIGEALAAGHDVLLAEGLGTPGDAASSDAAVLDGIAWLTDVYGQDEAVRQAVDQAALRVLTMKARLYPTFSVADVAVDPEEAVGKTGAGTEDVRTVARDALTRLAPAGGTPGSPQLGQRVLFVVDARPETRCAICPEVVTPDPEAIVQIARRAYGDSGAQRVADADLSAITFRELKAWLESTGAVPADATTAVPQPGPERLTEVGRLVGAADWMVFLPRDVRPQDAPGSDALKLFLKSTPPEQAGPQRLVLALGAPYYLDTTEIAGLTAYYGVYARTAPFLEVAVRAVFGDEPAAGASPVSVPGVAYDLTRMLEPAAGDVTLELIGRAGDGPVPLGTALTVRTSTMVDGNGHEVADGTPVTLRRFDRSEGLFLTDVEVTTESGRATGTVRAERPGALEISAVFANGLHSEPLNVEVEGGRDAALTPADAGPGESAVAPRPPVDWGILLLSLTAILLAGAVLVAADPAAVRAPSSLLRILLISLCLGLGGYLLVAAGGVTSSRLTGSRVWPSALGAGYEAPLFSFVLAMLAVGPAVIRDRLRAIRSADGLPGGQDGE